MLQLTKTSGLLIALCLALACASGGPTYSEFASTAPALSEGSGRIFLYMTDTTEVAGFRPVLTLDGAPIGEIHQGTFRYLDRPAGLHRVGVHAKASMAAFGDQAATDPVVIELRTDELAYVRVDVDDRAGMTAPVLTREIAADAIRDMRTLVHSEPPASSE